MIRLLLPCLLLAGCSPATPPPASPTPAPTPPLAAAATPAGTPADEGPPLPLLSQRPPGNPRAGLERAAQQPGYAQVQALTDNPVPWSEGSVMEGQMLYRTHCSSCHCWDGDGDGPASLGLNPLPRNFSRLPDYKYGTGDVALFRTARYGIPNSPMLPAPSELSDEQLWKIVHFLRMLQPVPSPAEVIIDLGPKTHPAVQSGVYEGESSEYDTWAWTEGREGRFRFPLTPQPGPYTLAIRAHCLATLDNVDVTVTLNGKPVGKTSWPEKRFTEWAVQLPPGSLKKGQNELVLRYSKLGKLSPTDNRESSLALDYVRIRPGPP